MIKKIILGGLLATTLVSAASADVLSIRRAQTPAGDWIITFVNDDRTRTVVRGASGETYASTLNRAINQVGAASVSVESFTQGSNTIDPNVFITENGEVTINLPNSRTETFTVSVTGANAVLPIEAATRRATQHSDNVRHVSGSEVAFTGLDTDNLGLSIADRDGVSFASVPAEPQVGDYFTVPGSDALIIFAGDDAVPDANYRGWHVPNSVATSAVPQGRFIGEWQGAPAISFPGSLPALPANQLGEIADSQYAAIVGTDFTVDYTGEIPSSVENVVTNTVTVDRVLRAGNWVEVNTDANIRVAYVYDGSTWSEQPLSGQRANLRIESRVYTETTIRLADARTGRMPGDYLTGRAERAFRGQTEDINSQQLSYNNASDTRVTHNFSVELYENDIAAINAVIDESFRTGYEDGYHDGYVDGYELGFEEGVRAVQ